MATGYTLTKTGNTTKVVHITDDVVDAVDGVTGPCWIQNKGTTIEISQGGSVLMSFAKTAIITIDGEEPEAALTDLIDQLIAVFPEASSGSSSGGPATAQTDENWDGSKRYHTLTADVDFVLDDETTYDEGILYLIQDATGSRAATIKWGTGGDEESLDINTTAGSITAVLFSVVNGVPYFTTDKTLAELTTSVPSGYDADSETYFTAASIIDTPTKDAADTVTTGLKAISMTAGGTGWSKALVLPILAGPDLAAQCVNLKNPGTHDLTLNGSMSYNANGLNYDGVDDYADPNFTPITHFSGSTAEWSILIGIGTNPGTLDRCAMGTNGDGSIYFYPKLTGGDIDFTGYSADQTTTPAATIGRYIITWDGATTLKLYRNGVAIKTVSVTPQAAHSTYKFYFGARSTSNTATFFTNERHNFYGIWDAAMTAGEAAAVDAVFSAYQTAMGR